MRAGALRHLITIQTPTTTKTDGVSVTTWGTYAANVPAEIIQLKGYDRANANAVWPGADYQITIRYLSGVTGNMRIVDESGTIYSILGRPDDVEVRHREINMMCQAGVKAK